jgi:beta-galactosidase/beta-glucuronidase
VTRRAVSNRALALILAALAMASSIDAARGAERPPRVLPISSGWLFQPDPLEVGVEQGWQRPDFDRSGWRTVVVPSAWDAYERTMDGYEGVCWYAVQLPASQNVPAAWQRLRFGRANHKATVWIDGERVVDDSLGYVPFEAPATPHLVAGRPAWIVVRVENGARYDWLPGTTTVEWVQYGGLLEPVELLTTSRAFIASTSIDARPRGASAGVQIVITVENEGDAPFQGRVRAEAAGQHAEAAVRVAPHASSRATLALTIPNARLWSPDTPKLYDLSARLRDDPGRVMDQVTERFGVRSIEARGHQLLLNGRPLRIRGVNRYNEFPGSGPVADDAAIRADLRAIKAAGANLVRVHFPQTPATLRIADELGLLYMEEVPLNWWRASWHASPPPEYRNDRIIDSAERALERMVLRDGNHPSIIIWSMANECLSYDSLGVKAMERLLRRAHALDSTRLVTYVANGAYAKNTAFRLADLVAVNLYYGMWDGEIAVNEAELETRVRQPTRDALADIARLFPDKPVLLSEFGTIGIPRSSGNLRFSEDYQAAYLTSVWQAVVDRPEICGGVVWSWADYRHRRGFTNDFPAFYGPFGLVTLDRKPKKALAALSAAWKRDAAR